MTILYPSSSPSLDSVRYPLRKNASKSRTRGSNLKFCGVKSTPARWARRYWDVLSPFLDDDGADLIENV